MTTRKAALLGLVLAVAAAAPATAQTAHPAEQVRVTVRPIHAGPSCDRGEVRACQSEARKRAIMCDAFSDRIGCADVVLAAQSACLRTTGCY